jgi:phosphatidate cytidylyltransferase
MMEGGKPQSDLQVRTLSAIVMIAAVLVPLWLGGNWFAAMIGMVGVGLIAEWGALSRAIGKTSAAKGGLILAGLVYIITAIIALALIENVMGFAGTLVIMALVWATDIGAYFAGRTIGGPKIAPAISPSKTWSGLIGGMIAASALLWIAQRNGWLSAERAEYPDYLQMISPLAGAGVAAIAQAGDFLESGMKRRAGVKDSGSLIPGHGGLFDRLDGLLPVAILFGILIFRNVL